MTEVGIIIPEEIIDPEPEIIVPTAPDGTMVILLAARIEEKFP